MATQSLDFHKDDSKTQVIALNQPISNWEWYERKSHWSNKQIFVNWKNKHWYLWLKAVSIHDEE